MAREKTLSVLEERIERIEAALLHRIPQVFDPPPEDFSRWGGWIGSPFAYRRIPIPQPEPGDPVPIDISHLTRAQLEVSLESIKAQRIRLDAMENMITQQLKQKG